MRGKHPGTSGGASYLKGLEQLNANLNAMLLKQVDVSGKGLIMASAYIRNLTETKYPKTPRDLGNLRASWFTVSAKGAVVGGEKRVFAKTFVGPNAAKIQTDYQSAITESQGIVRGINSKFKTFVISGYGANYAGFVHEMVGATAHTEGTDFKWLEIHMKQNINNILQIVATETKIP